MKKGKTLKERYTFTLDSEVMEKVKIFAKKEGATLSGIVEKELKQYVEFKAIVQDLLLQPKIKKEIEEIERQNKLKEDSK